MALAAAASRGALLLGDPYAPGLDGWYYVLQVRSWLDGAPLFADRSLLYPVLAAAGAATGDVVLGNKLITLALAAVTAAGGAVAGARLGQTAWAGLACGALWVASQGHLALSAEYLKNAAGVALLAWVLAACAGPLTRRWAAVAVVAALLGPLVHKLTGVLGLAALATCAGGAAWRSGRVRWSWAAVAVGAAAVGALALGLLRVDDLARITGELEGPAARWQTLAASGRPGLELAEVAATHVAPLALVALWRRGTAPLHVALIGLAAVCAAPGLPLGWDLTSWRLILLGFVPVGLAIAIVVGRAGRGGPWLAGALAAACVVATPGQLATRAARAPDYAAWDAALPILQAHVPAGDRVVAHRGVCGFIWAQGGIHCENFEPDGDGRGWWRVVYGLGAARLAPYATAPPVPLVPGYTLVDEPGYRAFRAAHRGRFRLLDDPRNPSEPRPAYVYGPEGPPDDAG